MRKALDYILLGLLAVVMAAGSVSALGVNSVWHGKVYSSAARQRGNVQIINESGQVVKAITLKPFPGYTSSMAFANWTSPATPGSFMGLFNLTSINGKVSYMKPIQVDAASTVNVNVDVPTFWNYTGGKAKYLDAAVSSRSNHNGGPMEIIKLGSPLTTTISDATYDLLHYNFTYNLQKREGDWSLAEIGVYVDNVPGSSKAMYVNTDAPVPATGIYTLEIYTPDNPAGWFQNFRVVTENDISILAKEATVAALGTPMQAGDYTAPDNVGIIAARNTLGNMSGMLHGKASQASVDGITNWITTAIANIASAVWNGAIVAVRTVTGGTIVASSVTAPVDVTFKSQTGIAAMGDNRLTRTHPGNWAATGSGGGGSAYTNPTTIEAYLAMKHGSGSWGAAGSFTIVGLDGSVTKPYATEGDTVPVKQGNTVDVPYKAGMSLVGRTVFFGGKRDPHKDTYDIALRDITSGVINSSAGTGLIHLTAADTASPGDIICELYTEDSAGHALTPLTIRLRVVTSVIRRP